MGRKTKMKKLIAALLSLTLFISVFASTAFAAAEKFTDVKPGGLVLHSGGLCCDRKAL